MKRIVSSRRRLARVCVISASAMKRFCAALSAVCRDRLRGCVNLAGARKRILRFALPSLSIDVDKARTLQFLGACLSPPKTVALWFSHTRKVQILFALCPSLVIATS